MKKLRRKICIKKSGGEKHFLISPPFLPLSYAKGEEAPNSDIDFLIEFKRPIELKVIELKRKASKRYLKEFKFKYIFKKL